MLVIKRDLAFSGRLWLDRLKKIYLGGGIAHEF